MHSSSAGVDFVQQYIMFIVNEHRIKGNRVGLIKPTGVKYYRLITRSNLKPMSTGKEHP